MEDADDPDTCIGCAAILTWVSVAFVCAAGCTWCAECAETQGGSCTNCGDALRRRAPRTRPLVR